MSFRLFIYYCALCGGWAAFLAWAATAALSVRTLEPAFLRVVLIGGLLGALVAGAVGMVDAVLNARGFARFVRTALCAALGGAGGLVGGLIGQGICDLTRNFTLLFIGWIIAGVFIGASVGVYDVLRAVTTRQDVGNSLKKVLNGVYGGFLGGFVGGILFDLIYGNAFLPRSDLAIGLVILGLCIGLLIGLAQVVLKEAWLKVESGFRAGRELMLSKEETTIGRAEGNDVGLFGDAAVEKLHARILLKNNRYLLADADTPGGTFLNGQPVTRPTPLRSGDAIRVGNSLLRFGERRKRG
jgi:hypothetical protein